MWGTMRSQLCHSLFESGWSHLLSLLLISSKSLLTLLFFAFFMYWSRNASEQGCFFQCTAAPDEVWMALVPLPGDGKA